MNVNQVNGAVHVEYGDGAGFDNYQRDAVAHAVYPRIRIIVDDEEPIDAPWLIPFLYLVSSAGGLAGKFTSIAQNDRGVLTRDSAKAISVDLGDVMWNVANVANGFGRKLSEIVRTNLERLAERKRRATSVNGTTNANGTSGGDR